MAKILIVEDEISISEMLKTCLEKQGYMVITAENGAKALNWVKEVKLDLAIVDLGLPDINGLEVCAAIKDDPRTSCIPIMILTGNLSNEARIKGNLEAKADLYLNKPIELADLRAAVGTLIGRAEKKKLLLRNVYKN
ncbi:MAG: response regulator transcription factor [Elusimicrobia bacterium]|nr:response regulator transcription factor [Elusimicrobiota bacterium]